MTTTRDIPREALRFRSQSKVRISFEKDEDGEPMEGQAHARFRILGATGKRIAHHGWFSNVYVDLASLEIPQQAPVLLDHNPSQRVGMADMRRLADRNSRRHEAECVVEFHIHDVVDHPHRHFGDAGRKFLIFDAVELADIDVRQ